MHYLIILLVFGDMRHLNLYFLKYMISINIEESKISILGKKFNTYTKFVSLLIINITGTELEYFY
jgi:hypothetical protein